MQKLKVGLLAILNGFFLALMFMIVKIGNLLCRENEE